MSLNKGLGLYSTHFLIAPVRTPHKTKQQCNGIGKNRHPETSTVALTRGSQGTARDVGMLTTSRCILKNRPDCGVLHHPSTASCAERKKTKKKHRSVGLQSSQAAKTVLEDLSSNQSKGEGTGRDCAETVNNFRGVEREVTAALTQN